MRTEPLYLEDSYLQEMTAQIIDVVPENEEQYRLVLNKTVFYPMGGGQPTDQGILSSRKWVADVYQVIVKDGDIWHYIKTKTKPNISDSVHGEINWDRRYKNMRLHSAGHIVDFAMFQLGYSPNKLTPIKADHGKKPFIVYEGLLNYDITQKLEAKANELVDKDLKFTWNFQPLDDLKKEAIYLQPNLPINKPLRTLRLENIGAVADGGTQIHSTKEAGKILITKIESVNNQTIINYSIAS